MRVWLFAAVLAAILIPSGVLGSYYFAGAQQSIHVTDKPSIKTNSTHLSAGGTVQVTGNNFTKSSTVSLSFEKALAAATLKNGSALVAQGNLESVAGHTPSVAASGTNGNGASGLAGLLKDLLGLFQGGAANGAGASTSTSSQSNVFLVVQTSPDTHSAYLSCEGQKVAQVNVTSAGAGIALANVTAGTHTGCTINTISASGNASAPLEQFKVSQNVNTTGASVQATVDQNGSFNTTMSVPASASGKYAIIALGSDQLAFEQVTIAKQAPTATAPTQPAQPTTTNNNTSTTTNQTSTPSSTSTSTSNSSSSSQSNASSTSSSSSASNATATSGPASVQLGDTNVAPGVPLAVSGQGFKPNTPVIILVNNVQVTNIITNVQGSFNSVVIVPTTVGSGSANVVVKSEQTNVIINKSVTVVKPSGEAQQPSAVAFAAEEGGQTLSGAPVTVFDTSNGKLVQSGKTPLQLSLKQGTYSVFYSAFDNHKFVSASPGQWVNTNDGGAGVVIVKGGVDMTVTAKYEQRVAPPVVTQPALSSLTLKAVDTSGNPLKGMFVTVYSADNGAKIQDGFTDMSVSNLHPGTYPIFFANFATATFASASPGTWVQTPYGGAGLVTIPDDGTSHSLTVTAVYQNNQTTTAGSSITAPFNISGTIFSMTSNKTTPDGPYINSGTFKLKVDSENPAQASIAASFVSARSDTNNNFVANSQQSRDHTTFQIENLKPTIARASGPDTYTITGTADILMDGTMYSSAEPVQITVTGGQDLSPAAIQIAFQGTGDHSGAARFETLYGAVELQLK